MSEIYPLKFCPFLGAQVEDRVVKEKSVETWIWSKDARFNFSDQKSLGDPLEGPYPGWGKTYGNKCGW